MTPDEKLAQEIVDELVRLNLISSTRMTEVVSKIAAGTVSIDDWTVWAELSTDEEVREHDHAAD